MKSRLHRLLGASAALFDVNGWGDDDLNSLTLTRGAGSEGPGILSGTATVTIRGRQLAPQHDEPLQARLTSYGADLVAALIGNRTAVEVRPRWFGRIARQTVSDTHRNNTVATHITAADWLAELARAEQPAPGVASGNNFPTILLKAVEAALLPPFWTIIQDPTVNNSWIRSVGSGTHTWEDISEAFTADAGTIVHQTRDGSFRATNLVGRRDAATAWDINTSQPLTRRQCLSPAAWEQPVSNPTTVKWSYTVAGGAGVNKSYRKGSAVRTIKETATDVAAVVYFPTAESVANFNMSMEGRAYRLGGWGYRVETVTLDLLSLLSSTVEADRQLAGQILTAEPYDPVVLTHDWPDEVKGFHYISEITETISRDRWDATLRLVPAVHLLGSVAETFTVPDGLTWDTGRPAGETWDTIPDHEWNGA